MSISSVRPREPLANAAYPSEPEPNGAVRAAPKPGSVEIVDSIPDHWGSPSLLPQRPPSTQVRWTAEEIASWPEAVLAHQARTLSRGPASAQTELGRDNLALIDAELRRRAEGERAPNERVLERLERLGAEPRSVASSSGSAALLASPGGKMAQGAINKLTRNVGSKFANNASSTVAHFFRAAGERKALHALSRATPRTLLRLQQTIPARVKSHIALHFEEIPTKPSHSVFLEGTSMRQVIEQAREVIASKVRPVLSSDDGVLAFVFEKELGRVIGTKGERTLRVVVDLEGRLVTAFPVKSALQVISVRGLAVSAQIAAVTLITMLSESEAAAATVDAQARREAADKTTWYEDALDYFGPYGAFSSSSIALDPNFQAIRERSAAALAEARQSLGRDLTAEEDRAIRQCVFDAWAFAATNV